MFFLLRSLPRVFLTGYCYNSYDVSSGTKADEELDSKISYEVSRNIGGQILRILRILEDSWGFLGIPRDP